MTMWSSCVNLSLLYIRVNTAFAAHYYLTEIYFIN